MTRARALHVVLVAGLVFGTAQRAEAYHFFEASNGACRWASVGVGTLDFEVDASSSPEIGDALLAEAVAARDRWNEIDSAQDVLGDFTSSQADFTHENFGEAWGGGFGVDVPEEPSDGRNEVVLDETGAILETYGLDPGDITSFTATKRVLAAGQCTITDAFHVVNGDELDGPAFDRPSTIVHGLGHVLGLAHSSVGQFNSRSQMPTVDAYLGPGLSGDVVDIARVPTMHPFGAGTGSERATPERDDVAGLTQLYPEAGAGATLGAIEGTVTRCSDGSALEGVSVRAVSTADPAVQATRYAAFDGNAEGRYRIEGLPPGDYRILVEPLGFNGFSNERMSIETRADAAFTTEYYGPTAEEEASCAEALPDAALPVAVVAGTVTSGIDIKVEGVDLVFVIDDTGSMSQELLALSDILGRFTAAAESSGGPLPRVGMLTYKDELTLRTATDDPAALRAAADALVEQGGLTCPESAHAALLAAGAMLRDGGTAILFSDAESSPEGPTTSAVGSYYRSHDLKASFLLSGDCRTGGFDPPRAGVLLEASAAGLVASPRDSLCAIGESCEIDGGTGPARPAGAATAESAGEPDALGSVDAITTFSDLAAGTGGVFVPIARPMTSAENVARYVNTAVNLSFASVAPAVSFVVPGHAASGAALEAVILGEKTSWNRQSTVDFGAGITAAVVDVASATSLTVALQVDPAAPSGFYDVVVTTPVGGGTETAVAEGAFELRASSGPELASIVPDAARPGSMLEVRIRGFETSFDDTSVVSLGDGISVDTVFVEGPEALTVGATIDPFTYPGFRPVSVTTGGAEVSSSSDFRVLPAGAPRIVGVSPSEAVRGQVVEVTIRGDGTGFDVEPPEVEVTGDEELSEVFEIDVVSELGFGAGVVVRAFEVEGPEELVAVLEIASDAPLGLRDVRASVLGVPGVLRNGFRIAASEPLPSDGKLAGCVSPGGALRYRVEVTEPFSRLKLQVKGDKKRSVGESAIAADVEPPLTAELLLTSPLGDPRLLARAAKPGGKAKSGKVSLLQAGTHTVTIADASGEGGCFAGRMKLDARAKKRKATLDACWMPGDELAIPFDVVSPSALGVTLAAGPLEGEPAPVPVARLLAPSGVSTDLPAAAGDTIRVSELLLAETGTHTLIVGAASGGGGCVRAKLQLR